MSIDALAIIPARGGSKRLPGKNLAKVGGLSLMQRAANALVAAGIPTDRTLLTTDDEAIASEGRRLGWLVPWLRPVHLATDSATTLDAVLHALDWWCDAYARHPDVVLLVQVTSPFRDPRHIQLAQEKLVKDQRLEGVIAACDLHRTSASLFVAGSDGLTPLGVDQDGPVLTPNGSFYAVRTRALREQRTFFPRRLDAIVMDRRHSLDIDTAFDLAMAETMAAMSSIRD